MYLCYIVIRLVGGSSYNEGRVEVNYNGEWGTVCDDGWDDTDAGVVCRQLGFGSSGTAIGSAYFGQGSGPIWLDSVACTGSESTLASCGHLGVGVTRSCSHSLDAAIICTGHYSKELHCSYTVSLLCILTDFSVRVQNRSADYPRIGRVEIYNNGQWGLVCANRWDTQDATVVCQEKELGSNGTATQIAYSHNETLWLSGVDCVGNESQLSSCPHNGIGVIDHEDCEFVAGVECFGKYYIVLALVCQSYP